LLPSLSLCLLQMRCHHSQPLQFLSLPSLSCALRPTANTVPFQIERLASEDGRNQASSSGIEQEKAESSGIGAASSGRWRNRVGGGMRIRRQGDALPLSWPLTTSALK
jgi:hypothetical protein